MQEEKGQTWSEGERGGTREREMGDPGHGGVRRGSQWNQSLIE